MKYLDPVETLSDCEADPGTPGAGSSFGNAEELRWIEHEIDVEPKLAVNASSIWDYLYSAIRDGETFPISSQEALNVMEIIDRAKEGTEFERR